MKTLLTLLALLLFTSTINAATANLLWDASPTVGVTYHVYQSAGTNPFSLALTTASTSATMAFTVTTRFYVAAFNSDGESTPSNTLTVNPPGVSPPAPPTNLRATAISASRIDLQWDPFSLSSVFVERNLMPIAVVTAQSYYLDTGLRKNRVYSYRVRGTNTEYSTAASAKTFRH